MIHHHVNIDCRRNGGTKLRHHRVDAIHRIDDVGAGLAIDEDQNGGLPIGIPRATNVFHRVHCPAYVGDSHGRPAAVSQDQRLVLRRLEDLIVGANLPSVMAV